MTTIVNEPDRLEQVGLVHRITLSTDSEQPGVLLTVSPFGQSIVPDKDAAEIHAWLGKALGLDAAKDAGAPQPEAESPSYAFTPAAAIVFASNAEITILDGLPVSYDGKVVGEARPADCGGFDIHFDPDAPIPIERGMVFEIGIAEEKN